MNRDGISTLDPARGPTTLHRRVEHSDVDGYGVVHFSRYAAFMEAALLDDLETRGLGLERLGNHKLELRVRELNVRYLVAVRHRDWLLLEPRLAHVGAASLRVEVKISRAEGEDGPTVLAVGTLSLAFVSSESGRPVVLPATLAELLKEGP